MGLFFYAGHGIQADGTNYLIPTKVKIPTQVELKHRAMSADFVLEKMEYTKSDLNIVILDACRNNPLPEGRGGTRSGLAEMNGQNSMIIFSTAPGAKAYDGSGRNSVFTKHLLNGIKKYGYMPIEGMLKQVNKAVRRETSNKPVQQVPWMNSSLADNFCFSQSGCTNWGTSIVNHNQSTNCTDNKFSLVVNAAPFGSLIKIMNIKPKYKPGICLSPGEYDIYVTHPHYQGKRQWIEIKESDFSINVNLF